MRRCKYSATQRRYQKEQRAKRLITAASNSCESIRINRTTTKTWKQKLEEKNNCMDISSDKRAKSHTRRVGHS